ncbi:MAG TPA: IclR family transcriptional regulator, partial [Firmicutes bacterium]|nr:IclR family transcriptional regulator [Bacillota bacterium]
LISPHCTALGKTILAVLPEGDRDAVIQRTEFHRFTPNTITDPSTLKGHLQQVAIQGFAFDDEEHEEGIRCAAAPVRDHSGGIVGAISISAPITRMSKQRMEEMGVLVKDVCSRLSTSLGYKER